MNNCRRISRRVVLTSTALSLGAAAAAAVVSQAAGRSRRSARRTPNIRLRRRATNAATATSISNRVGLSIHDIDGAAIPSDKTETRRRRNRPHCHSLSERHSREGAVDFVRRPEGDGPGRCARRGDIGALTRLT